MDADELRARGLLRGGRVLRFEPPGFGEAHPDEGFGGRTASARGLYR